MNDRIKTNRELLEEISSLKQRIHELEKSDEERRQTEALLKEELAFRHTLFENSPDGILIIDPQTSRFLEFNTMAHRQLGYSREEFAQLSIFDIEAKETAAQTKTHIAEVIQNGRSDFETLQRTRQGELRTVHVSAQFINVEGRPVYHCTWRDMTERKQIEEALRTSENLYRTFINACSDIVFLKDEQFRYEVVNKAMAAFFGMPAEDLIGKTDFDFMMKSEAEKCHQTDMKALTNASPVTFEEIVGGQVFETLKFPVALGNDKIGVGGFIRNISDRRLAEEALKESEKRYRSLFEEALDGIFITAPDGRVMDANKAGIKMFGYDSKEEILHLNLEKDVYTGSKDRGHVLEILREQGSVEFDLKLRRKGGESLLAHLSCNSVKDNQGREMFYRTVVHDITTIKKMELESQDSLRFLDTLINMIPSPIVYRDAELRYRGCNRAFEKFIGVEKKEIVGKTLYDLYPKEVADEYYARDMALLQQSDQRDQVYEHRMTRADGSVRDILFNRATYKNSDGTIGGLVAVMIDVTEHKHAENELRKSEAILRSVFKTLPIGLCLMRNRVFQDVNKTWVENLGYSEAELIGHNPRMLYESEEEYNRVGQELFTNLTERGLALIETVHKKKNGERCDVIMTAVPLQMADSYLGMEIVTIVDVTDRKRLEERLQRSEKMEALGTLAGGVAHDLNNVLGIIVGFAELLLRKEDASSAIRPQLANIVKAGQRAAAIVDDLLTLARRGVSSRQVLNLNQIVTDMQQSPELEKLCSYHPTVVIKTELEPSLLNISGSAVHLSKSLFNLVSNASEAMPRGGILTIQTNNQYLDKPIQGYDEVREGDYVVLSVSDTGEGIPAADLKRIFEPFYTKKIMGRSGTGLGLSVVWGTVKDHKGYINIQSEEGKGSTFTLYFPVTRENLSSKIIPLAISEYMGHGESILVVDDVKEQRDLAASMLKMLNYKVASVSSGEEAIKYLQEHKSDLMVLDMIMAPGMDGLDTYRMALEICPQQKAIIVSGFSETDRVQGAQALGAGVYVKKPYVLEILGLAVKKELDKK